MHNEDALKEEIEKLQYENNVLRQWQNNVNALLQQIMDLISENDRLTKENNENIAKLWQYSVINRYRIDSLPYELMDPDFKSFYFKPKILSKDQTREEIIKNRMSITRFGDGEFAAIVRQKRWNFQDTSELLSQKLKDVLLSENNDGILIGLNPNFYMNLFELSESDADGVRAYMRPMVRKLHAELLSKDTVYGNAIFHEIITQDDVTMLKQIWDDRDCVFIEGVHTGMGVGNDLFDNCKSIERILGPAENAITKYDEIIQETLKQPKDKLILLALGPTATALAYDLYKHGYQAVDIGHIDLVYESFIRKTDSLYDVKIPYKYCSEDERISGREIPTIDDPVYKSQVKAIIA